MTAPTSRKLTPKQETFCLAYMETGNASEAYRSAYDVDEDAKPEGVHVDASKLLADLKGVLRIADLKAKAATEATLDRAWALGRLMRNADDAREAGDFTASNKALELLGKTNELAMFTEQSATTVNVKEQAAEFRELLPATARWLAEITTRGNADKIECQARVAEAADH